MINFNFDKVSYLSKETIYYHIILYNRYLDNLNKLLIKNKFDFNISKEDIIRNLELFNIEDRESILFNLGGVLNHELYFKCITSNIDNIMDIIISKYKSYDNFKNEFKKIALTLKGSGYTFLVLDTSNNLDIINLSNQMTPLIYNFKPLIALDIWEHAYYIDYKVDKNLYIDEFLNNLNSKKYL